MAVRIPPPLRIVCFDFRLSRISSSFSDNTLTVSICSSKYASCCLYDKLLPILLVATKGIASTCMLSGSRKYFVPENVETNFVYFKDCSFGTNRFRFFFDRSFFCNSMATSTSPSLRIAVVTISPSGTTGCPVTVPVKRFCSSNDQSCNTGTFELNLFSKSVGLGSLNASAVAISICSFDENTTKYAIKASTWCNAIPAIIIDRKTPSLLYSSGIFAFESY